MDPNCNNIDNAIVLSFNQTHPTLVIVSFCGLFLFVLKVVDVTDVTIIMGMLSIST